MTPGNEKKTIIVGVGAEIPERIVTSAEVESLARVDRYGLEAGWLEHVTGVKERRWAAPDVTPSALAASAGQRALEDAHLVPGDIDVLIFASITRDFIEPATANVVQERLGTRNARVFDLTNACNGIIDSLDVADSLLATGKARNVLLVTGERASISVNLATKSREEFMRSVAGLVVGDGGGGLVLSSTSDPNRGLQTREYRSDGRHWALATGGRFRPSDQSCPNCGSLVEMPFMCDGRALFAVGIEMMVPTMVAAMGSAGWSYDELDLVFCHEASRRFVESGMARLGDGAHPGPKIWSTVERFGNTSTVSLPLALSEARAANALSPGAKVLLLGGSSGASMAAVTMRW